MILPRRLMTLADDGTGKIRFCEADDPKQAMNYRAKGYPIPDAEAERIGLKAYLDETGWGETAREKGDRKVTEAAFEKSLAQTETENKAVEQKDVEDKGAAPSEPELHVSPEKDDEKDDDKPDTGLHIDPALRRGGRRSA